MLVAAVAASAAPKSYVFTGKFTVNRGTLINVPMVGDTPCAGAGLSSLRIMSGPFSRPANDHGGATAMDFGCAGFVTGKQVTTTGIGVGGQLTVPTQVLSRLLPDGVAAIAFR